MCMCRRETYVITEISPFRVFCVCVGVFMCRTLRDWYFTTGLCLMDMRVPGQPWLPPGCCSITSWSSCKMCWMCCATSLAYLPPAWGRSQITTRRQGRIGPSHAPPPSGGPQGPQGPLAPLLLAFTLRKRSSTRAWWLEPWRMPSKRWWGRLSHNCTFTPTAAKATRVTEVIHVLLEKSSKNDERDKMNKHQQQELKKQEKTAQFAN